MFHLYNFVTLEYYENDPFVPSSRSLRSIDLSCILIAHFFIQLYTLEVLFLGYTLYILYTLYIYVPKQFMYICPLAVHIYIYIYVYKHTHIHFSKIWGNFNNYLEKISFTYMCVYLCVYMCPCVHLCMCLVSVAFLLISKTSI